jgi:hypothetical protein
VISPVVQAFPTPALRKEREGRGTHFAGDANEIKSLGHPARRDGKVAGIDSKPEIDSQNDLGYLSVHVANDENH